MAIYLVERGENKGTRWIDRRGAKKEVEDPNITPDEENIAQDTKTENDIEDEKQARRNIQRKASYDNKKRDIIAGKNLIELEEEILKEKDLTKREQLLDRWIELRYPGITQDKEVRNIIGQWVTSLGFKTPLLSWLYKVYKTIQNKNLLVAVNNTYSDGTLKKEDLLGTSISGDKHIIFHSDLSKLKFYNDIVYMIKIYEWAESEYDIRKYIKTNFYRKKNSNNVISFFNLHRIEPTYDPADLRLWGITEEQAKKAFDITKPSQFRNYLIYNGDSLRDPDDIMDDVDKLDDYISEESELGNVQKQMKLSQKPSEQEVVDYFTSKGITQLDIKNLANYSDAISRLKKA